LNRNRGRIPRRFCLTAALRGLRGSRGNICIGKIFYGEDPPLLAAGSVNPRKQVSGRAFGFYLDTFPCCDYHFNNFLLQFSVVEINVNIGAK
jgi:hypothetical protein